MTDPPILCPECGHWDEQHHARGCVADACDCSLTLANVYYRCLMADRRGVMTRVASGLGEASLSKTPASQLAPPHLSWIRAGMAGETCELCRAPILAWGDCFLSIRRAFEMQGTRMVETDPLRVLMCLDCGAKARYTDMAEMAQDATQTPKGAPPMLGGPQIDPEPASRTDAPSSDREGDAEKLLFYAYRFDDKPHQFWNQCRIQAEKRGMTAEALEFDGWYENGDPWRQRLNALTPPDAPSLGDPRD